MELADKMSQFVSGLDYFERDNYKLLLSTAARGLAPLKEEDRNSQKIAAFSALCQCISSMEKSGLIWHGRPGFMNDDLLTNLQAEAIERRKMAHQTQRHFLCSGGKYAQELTSSQELKQFISQLLNNIKITSGPFYLYYDMEGCGVDPHIDRDICNIGFLINIYHTYEDSPSNLILFLPDGKIKKILINPGEAVLFYTGGTIHARENVKNDESLCSLLLGFSSDIGNEI